MVGRIVVILGHAEIEKRDSGMDIDRDAKTFKRHFLQIHAH